LEAINYISWNFRGKRELGYVGVHEPYPEPTYLKDPIVSRWLIAR
jgi:hypothetical protein